ncbi:hypothetical protein BGX38DRAFT_862121 [Terfezia claveryi]|nr:hypothetical protein BGX38DRAFT_862121 [Terfezia claveryi]
MLALLTLITKLTISRIHRLLLVWLAQHLPWIPCAIRRVAAEVCKLISELAHYRIWTSWRTHMTPTGGLVRTRLHMYDRGINPKINYQVLTLVRGMTIICCVVILCRRYPDIYRDR